MPIRFGVEAENGVVRDRDGSLRIAAVADVGEDALVVHDAHRDDPSLAFALSRLSSTPDGPTPIGIFRQVSRPVSGRDLTEKLALARAGAGDARAGRGAARRGHVDRLLDRGSDKWTAYPPDVLPAWVAEMDFPLAPPVKAVLHDAIERDDLGYVGRTEGMLEAFAGFAARRLNWERRRRAGRARHGRDGRHPGARAGADGAGRRRDPQHAGVSAVLPRAGAAARRGPAARGRRARHRRHRRRVRGRREGDGALQPAQPDRADRAAARSWRRSPRSPTRTARG